MNLVFETGVDLKRLRLIGRRLASALRPGDLVLLEGHLGSGKTELVREVCRGLGVVGPVRSPSFTLANMYAGVVRVNHLDLYRVPALEAADALVPEEFVGEDVITLVEWPEVAGEVLGRYSYKVYLEHETLERAGFNLWPAVRSRLSGGRPRVVNVSGRVGVNGSEEHGAGSVLCLDTATDWCSVALLDTGTTGIEVKSESALEAGRSHARLLLPMIDRVLGAADIGPDGVAAIVVGCGPGTFTGVRMGVATGRAIALGLGVPIAGVSTLGALAAAATGLGSVGAQGVETLAVCVDARRGELFVAAYRRWRRAHTSDQTHPVSPAPVSPETSVMWHKVGES